MEKSLEKTVDVLQQYMYKTAPILWPFGNLKYYKLFVKHNALVAKAIRQL